MSALTEIYTKINNRILFDNKKKYPSPHDQMAYMESFPEPRNEVERSYFKYRCLMYCSYSKKQRFIVNLISFFALAVLVPLFRIKGLRCDQAMRNYQPKDLLLRKAATRIPIQDIFPDKLMQLQKNTVDYPGVPYFHLFITRDAFSLFGNAWRKHPFHFHYLMVIFVRLSQACYLLQKYSPAAITTYVCEREFADCLLTEFYENHGIQYHGFMHGDFLRTIDQAFMHLTKYWVWAEEYKEMFQSLRGSYQIEVYTPGKYSGIVVPRSSAEAYDYYATYYFSNESEESLIKVRDALMKLTKQGHRCKVRAHPRFSNLELIRKAFKNEIDIEDNANMTIEQSLECTYYSIALMSTVLSQAYHSGKKIVIDDISDPEKFELLREEGYILIDKSDILFSQLVNQKESVQ